MPRSHTEHSSWLLLAGSTAVLASLFAYFLATNDLVIGPSTDAMLQTGATMTLVTFGVGLGLVLLGVHLTLSRGARAGKEGGPSNSLLSSISGILSKSPYHSFFIAATVLYGFIFSLASGTLIYQPLGFPASDSVSFPSVSIITCCNSVGQTPRLVVYLMPKVGILLIPLNILLLLATSWLVGANFAIATFAYRDRTSGTRGWFGSFGALTGLFSACPTCAGTLILASFGGGEAVAASLAPAQSIFIEATILLLAGNLLAMASRLNVTAKCAIVIGPASQHR